MCIGNTLQRMLGMETSRMPEIKMPEIPPMIQEKPPPPPERRARNIADSGSSARRRSGRSGQARRRGVGMMRTSGLQILG